MVFFGDHHQVGHRPDNGGVVQPAAMLVGVVVHHRHGLEQQLGAHEHALDERGTSLPGARDDHAPQGCLGARCGTARPLVQPPGYESRTAP